MPVPVYQKPNPLPAVLVPTSQDLDEAVASLNGSIADLGSKLNASNVRVEAVAESLENVNGSIQNLTVTVSSLLQRMNRADEDLDKQIEDIWRAITELSQGGNPVPDPEEPEELEDPEEPEEPTPEEPEDPEEPTTKKLIKPSNLKLLGGWRVPNIVGGTQMGYTQGLHAFHKADGTVAFLINSAIKSACFQVAVDGPMSTDLAKPTLWNLLKSDGQVANISGRGVYRDSAGVIWTSDDGGYITNGFDRTLFQNSLGKSFNLAGDPVARDFGGGFCDIPLSWQPFFGGATHFFGQGGYESGQGSSAGPSCAAGKLISTDGVGLDLVKPLILFGSFNTQDKSKRERRPTDYSTPLWSPKPDGLETIEPDDDIGYWATDRILCGPVAIDTPEFQGVLYWSLQGTGSADYQRQSETFGEGIAIRLYVYDLEDLKRVYRGEMQPWEIRGKFYDIPRVLEGAVQPNSWNHRVEGASWLGDKLYVLHRWIWGGNSEWWPVILCYEIGE